MKKRLLTAFLALIMCLALGCTGTPTTENELRISAVVDGVEIGAVEADGETYLFLPSNADLSALALRIEVSGEEARSAKISGDKGKANNAEAVDLTAIARPDDEDGYELDVKVKGAQREVHIMQGSGLATMYLHSADAGENRTWVDESKEHEAEGSMLLLDAGGESIYDGALTQIKARGNSTFSHYPKKAYQIKLEEKTDLLGTGEKVKTWVLLANYGDATLIHDKFFKDFAAELGMDYVTSCDWVNLYYDGEYRGVYLLSEKVEVGGSAIDITDMEEAYEELNDNYGDDAETAEGTNAYGQTYQYTVGLTEPEDITGGWLIEKNHDYIDEACGFFTKQEVAFNVKGPEYAGQEAMAYISEYYQAFENAVYAQDADGNYTGYNEETGKYYYEYCDLDSLVQFFIIQELGRNPDSFYSSTFFRKEVDDIMYVGPLWDMDMTLGTGWENYIPARSKDYHYIAKPLVENNHFRAAVAEYYTDVFRPAILNLLAEDGKVDTYIAALAPSAAMNYKLWPYVRIGAPYKEGHLWEEGTDYRTVTDDMKAWLTERVTILDAFFLLEK